MASAKMLFAQEMDMSHGMPGMKMDGKKQREHGHAAPMLVETPDVGPASLAHGRQRKGIPCAASRQVRPDHDRAIRTNIASSADLLVHITRERGKRLVSEVLEITSSSVEDDEYRFRSLYER